jgi:hypothetical protein
MNPYQPPSREAEISPSAPATVEAFSSVGGLFGRALSLYFGNLGSIAAITLIVFIPVEFGKNYLEHAANLEDNIAAGARIETFVESVFGALVTAALLHALSHKIRTGRDLSVREAFARGSRRWGSVFGARFRAGLWVLLGLLALVVPGLMWLVKYALTDEIATLEVNRSSKRVLNRSAELTRGYGWKICGVGLLAFLPVVTLQVAGGVVSGLAGSWVVTALLDSVNDVVYRFLTAVMLLIYLGLDGEAVGETGPATSS